MKKKQIKFKTYKDFLKSLTKKELLNITNKHNIECKKNLKKEKYIELIYDNLETTIKNSLNLFQMDEYFNIKFLIKKKGLITIKYNDLLLDFLKKMEQNYLVFKLDNNNYYTYDEILNYYKSCLKSSKIIKTFKYNTKEYNLILGYTEVYGSIEYDVFYNRFTQKYNYSKEELLKRLEDLANFYSEFNVIKTKDNVYITHSSIKTMKECKEYDDSKIEYANYINKEIENIHNFKYFKRVKSYKRLVRFIKSNYNINNGSIKIINRFVLIPYIVKYQKDKNNANKYLDEVIDKYFEYNNAKHKNKFIKLIIDLAEDYPKWSKKGNK